MRPKFKYEYPGVLKGGFPGYYKAGLARVLLILVSNGAAGKPQIPGFYLIVRKGGESGYSRELLSENQGQEWEHIHADAW